jgi:hypothetical protein
MDGAQVFQKWQEKYGLRADVLPLSKLKEYLGQTKNPHRHRHKDLAALEGSYSIAGMKNPILLWNNPATGLVEVIYGAGRIMAADIWEGKRAAALRGYETDFSELPCYWATDFNLAKATFLRAADNRVNQLATVYDDGILIDHLRVLKDHDVDISFLKFGEGYERALINDLAAGS